MNVKRPLVINQPHIGKLIRELRLRIALTQEQFAAHLGVTYSSMNRWENGRSRPSPLAMQKIEAMLEQMGDHGRHLLEQYLAEPTQLHSRQADVASVEGARGNEASRH